jgi:hypothetical protein
MIQLKENQGIPRSILLMMAIVAGLTVANCYYNQPLLELIRHDLGITEQKANLITVITQIGYALGLFFLIPLGDMLSRKKLILVNMTIAALMAIVMAAAQNVWMLWGASLLIGACSVIPQFFIPIAGQFSEPKNKSRNMGIVLSGLLTGILAYDNLVIFTATGEKQLSNPYKDQNHGLFTYFMLKGIKGEADKDNNKNVSLDELQNYIKDNVSRESRKLGQTRIQEPSLKTTVNTNDVIY